MRQLVSQQDLRTVQRLPFCYLCGKPFGPDDQTDRDHVPPRKLFLAADRSPTLWLPTHKACNGGQNLADEKIGQLIALRYGQVPAEPKNRRLAFAIGEGLGAVVNCDVDGAVWRWIRGFHAALYAQLLTLPIRGALVTPFPRARLVEGPIEVEPLLPQHAGFVRTIKQNRAAGALDRIAANGGKLVYECVWAQAENDGPWLCIFALDLYDWKDMGATGVFAARGCAGFYHLPSGLRPAQATLAVEPALDVANRDPLDPFGP